jgi:hypothetical protein
MTNGPNPQTDPSELQKLQFDYAWKWFSHHANQRVKMFNFMLIALGVFATAIVSAIANHLQSGFAAVLCFVAAAFALAFSLLDDRNRYLVSLGEELLAHLERSTLFGQGVSIQDRDGKTIQFGVLSRQESEEWGKRGLMHDICHGKHRVWLPFVSRVMSALFVVAGIWILYHPQ